jgi:hypothetical protein
MRVLYVSHFGGLGGAERSLLELAREISVSGVDPVLACPAGSLAREAEAVGVAVSAWPAPPFVCAGGAGGALRSLPGLFQGWRELDETVRRFRPDVVHANSAQAMLWCAPVAWRRGRALVWHWRDFYEFRRLARRMVGRADIVITISEAMHSFASELLGPAARRAALVRNGVADSRDFCDETSALLLRRSLGVPDSAPLVLMAGQSVPRKGHEILLRALARLTKTRPDLHAWLLCPEHHPESAEHTQRLRRLAAELGCGPSIRITGGVDRIAHALRAADVVAVPSLREPFGRVAVEAMLAERPVIASAVDGLSEIVEDGESGYLVPPGNHAQLGEALARMLDEPARRRAQGAAARRRALQLFSISRVAGEVASLYATLRTHGAVRPRAVEVTQGAPFLT